MKNWEKYEKEIKEIGITRIAFDKRFNEIVDCNNLSCEFCKFSNTNDASCRMKNTEWLYEDFCEHKQTDWTKVKVDAKVKVDGEFKGILVIMINRIK